MFSSYLEFLTMDEVQKPSDSDSYTQSSEPFIFCYTEYLNINRDVGLAVLTAVLMSAGLMGYNDV
jgi:hypothetical protein